MILNIREGKLLEPFIRSYLNEHYPNHEIPSGNKVKDKVKVFQKEWDKKGERFVKFLEDNELKFKKNIIDCFIVSATPRDMSAPLIIRSRYSRKEFMEALYHELIHIALVDNQNKHILEWNVPKTTRNHLRVFALLEKYYLEVLKDKRGLKKLKKKSEGEKNIDYKMAWKIVEQLGYDQIIKNAQ